MVNNPTSTKKLISGKSAYIGKDLSDADKAELGGTGSGTQGGWGPEDEDKARSSEASSATGGKNLNAELTGKEIADGHAYDSCKTSMGQRTAFVGESLRLIKQAPLFGNGAGSFWYGNPETGYNVNNPHNQYLLETVQTGLVGLALFLLWMLYCYREAWRQPVPVRNLMVAVLSAYMACHLFNSFLLDSAEGHLFMVIAAMLAAKAIGAKAEHYP